MLAQLDPLNRARAFMISNRYKYTIPSLFYCRRSLSTPRAVSEFIEIISGEIKA